MFWNTLWAWMGEGRRGGMEAGTFRGTEDEQEG